MSQLLDDLKAVDNLLDTNENWIQGTWAKCSLDLSVAATNPRAISWCLEGAIYHVLGEPTYSLRYMTIREALQDAFPKKFRGRDIPRFNDSKQTTFRVVKNALKRAIATEQAAQELVPA